MIQTRAAMKEPIDPESRRSIYHAVMQEHLKNKIRGLCHLLAITAIGRGHSVKCAHCPHDVAIQATEAFPELMAVKPIGVSVKDFWFSPNERTIALTKMILMVDIVLNRKVAKKGLFERIFSKMNTIRSK